MTQAVTLPPAPTAYGSAFAEVLEAVHALTDDQVTELHTQWNNLDPGALGDATEHLDEALSLLGEDVIEQICEDGILGINTVLPARDVLYAVLLRDRGLLTAADFAALTRAWTRAGLPLPAAVTGDSDVGPFTAINEMTSDLLADELLHAAASTPQYGATLVLTGYNHGELLAYPAIRQCIDRHDGEYRIDWNSLAVDHASGDFEDLGGIVDYFLTVALALLPGGEFGQDISADNAEVITLAVAYTTGAAHLLEPRDLS
jgi:hypothetical protein